MSLNLSLGSNVEISNADYVPSSLLETDAYEMKVKVVYLTTAKSGAVMANVVLQTNEGKEVTDSQCIISGDAKGNKTTYSREVGGVMKSFPLPGYLTIHQLGLLTCGKTLEAIGANVEEKVLELYSYEQSKKVPTKVKVLSDFTGTEVIATVEKQLINKKDQQGNPTADTRETNEVVKYYRTSDKGTVAEIEADNGSAGTYLAQWVEKNQGKLIDKTSKDLPKTTAPKAQASTGTPAATPNLFAPKA